MATFKDIQEANKEIKTMPITRWDKKLGKEVSKDYAEVNQRIKAFRMVYPEGFITTEIVSHKDGVVYMKAEAGVFTGDGQRVVLGSGMAYEDRESSLINKTSYIENCETSAVGRALGMCGFGIDMSVASYEEVSNAIKKQEEIQKPEEYTCSACGATFTDKKYANATMKKYKKYICPDCIEKKRKEVEQKKKEKEAQEQAEQNTPEVSQSVPVPPNETDNSDLPFEF